MDTIQRRSRSVLSGPLKEGREGRFLLERLRRSFQKFRRAHSPHTRIPHALRDMALLALQEGASNEEVRRVCRLTSSQLATWKKVSAMRMRPSDPIGPIGEAPRIYPVVDEASRPRLDGSSVESEGALELHFGGWAICIQRRTKAS